MFYRVKQFLWGITAPFKKIDKEYISKYLNDEELKLFNNLTIADRHHCIRVCKDAMKTIQNRNINIDREKLGKIALLHDIGKGQYSLNPIEKSVLVILNKVTKGNLKNYTKNKKIDSYYNHPNKGFDILSKYRGYDKEFLEVVQNHHCEIINNNIYLKLIKECDDKN